MSRDIAKWQVQEFCDQTGIDSQNVSHSMGLGGEKEHIRIKDGNQTRKIYATRFDDILWALTEARTYGHKSR